MKRNALIRIVFIGLLHTFLYLWFVPFVIYPRFGDSGLEMTVAVAVLISVALLVTLFVGRSKKKRPDTRGDSQTVESSSPGVSEQE